MNIQFKLDGKAVQNPGGALSRTLHSQILRAVEKALRSEGFKLKRDMSSAIKSGDMDWKPVKPLTLVLRKRFRRNKAPGVFFAQFVRYAVGKTEKGFTLKVGVFNPGFSMRGAKVKPLSRGIIANAERFARGFEFRADEEYRRARIRTFLAAKGIDDWESLSKRRKAALKRQMAKLGVFVRKGAVIKAPPRPADTFLEKNKGRIEKELSWLLERAIRNERWSKNWWQEVSF